nr:hypothetical protein [uncultured Bacteroides sp.]
MKKIIKVLRTRVVPFPDGSYWDVKDVLIIGAAISAFVFFKSK